MKNITLILSGFLSLVGMVELFVRLYAEVLVLKRIKEKE